MAFMISKETENVQSSEEIENAFRAITQERVCVTRGELYDHLSKDMADYCIGKMIPYVDPKTGESVPDAYDFMEFTRTLFQNS
jgi:spectrin alpha